MPGRDFELPPEVPAEIKESIEIAQRELSEEELGDLEELFDRKVQEMFKENNNE